MKCLQMELLLSLVTSRVAGVYKYAWKGDYGFDDERNDGGLMVILLWVIREKKKTKKYRLYVEAMAVAELSVMKSNREIKKCMAKYLVK